MKSFFKALNIPIVTIFLIGCSTNTKTVAKTYGNINESNRSKIILIDPSEHKSFIQLVDRVEQIVCHDSIPTIRLFDKGAEKLLALANPCWEEFGCILFKRRNVLKIQDEYIQMEQAVPLDSLEEFVSEHYFNNGTSLYFSESPSKATVSIIYRELPADGLESLMKKVISSYDNLNIEVPLMLSLTY